MIDAFVQLNCSIIDSGNYRSKNTPKSRVTGLCVGNSPGTGGFPAQKTSNAENVSTWWRHHDQFYSADRSEVDHQGCYGDSTGHDFFDMVQFADLTPTRCRDHCSGGNYKYYALQVSPQPISTNLCEGRPLSHMDGLTAPRRANFLIPCMCHQKCLYGMIFSRLRALFCV